MERAAQDTINAVEQSALRKLSGRNDQVGFDLFQFIDNIQGIFDDGSGGVSILDTNRMGTVEDFEAIGDDKTLWHMGTGSGEKFRKSVFSKHSARSSLSARRQGVWGETTPQWLLMEFGSHSGGEYPPVPAAHFIGAVRDDPNKILKRWLRDIRMEMSEMGGGAID
jgi:hypothetical protein